MVGLTALMGQCVWDAEGVWVGHVVDIRVVRNKRESMQSHTVMGLVVSVHRAPVMLGLTRDRQGRLGWLSEVLARVVYAGCTFVPWEMVASSDTGEVHLRAQRKELTRV
ncbi:hypothetical protein ACFXJ8_30055 [Nonomuraea sp. NPDC059194]|uniref:hypothetical protein n=1 Tax=Nonomuraea sp. NPDC059194 TaxID=3346764 RepID=UPI0036A42CD5